MEIGRTRFKKEIVSEYIAPVRKSNKVIIIASGAPGYPSKKQLMNIFSEQGFWVFMPRYRGTFESDGIFLEKSPHLDIEGVIDGVSEGFTDIWTGASMKIKNPKIYLVGGSFGGPAVLLNSKNPKVKKVLALSSVIDWRVDSEVEPMDKLEDFMSDAFRNVYRMKKNSWTNLLNGKRYNPATMREFIDPKKVMLMHVKDDEVVLPFPVISFAKEMGIPLKLLNKGGHMGSSLLLKPKYRKIALEFFK